MRKLKKSRGSLAFGLRLNPSRKGIPSELRKLQKVGGAKRKEFDKYCLVEDLHTRAGQLFEILSSKIISLGPAGWLSGKMTIVTKPDLSLSSGGRKSTDFHMLTV